jgi:hypothetical protein
MDRNVLRWAINLGMGVVFVISFMTGLLKFTVLLRLTGTESLLLPSARISDLHDGIGMVLGLLVITHLYLNRQWIVSMTRKVIWQQEGPEENTNT